MSKSCCHVCGKTIAEDAADKSCVLCSIGLTPVLSDQGSDSFIKPNESASGRVLSGSHCPDCRAELSLADLSLKRCGICDEPINLEMLNQDIQVRQTREPTFRPTKQINAS